MLIGILGSGAVVGFVVGFSAFVLGQSFLVALGIYMMAGVATSVMVTFLTATLSVVQKRRPEQASFARERSPVRGFR